MLLFSSRNLDTFDVDISEVDDEVKAPLPRRARTGAMWRAWSRGARAIAAHACDARVASAPTPAPDARWFAASTRACSRVSLDDSSTPSPSVDRVRDHRGHLAPWTTSRRLGAFAHARGYASKVKRGVRVKPARPRVEPATDRASADSASSDAPGAPPRSGKKTESAPPRTPPPLKDAMRRLVRAVHPDLFASGPAGASAVNDESLKTIQGVLDAVTKSRVIPDAGIKRLKFYVRDAAAPEGVRVVTQNFKTTGGDCRNLVAKQLKELFSAVGVSSEFRWNEGDWTHDPESATNARARGDVAKGWDLYPAARSHADASSSSSRFRDRDVRDRDEKKRRADLHGALKVNDKLFEAIAAVPWIPEPVGDDRVRAINDEIVPRLEKEGWRVSRDVIERIWRGERNDASVMDGVDAASGLALSAIVRHSRNFDRAYGKPNAPRINFYPKPPPSADDETR